MPRRALVILTVLLAFEAGSSARAAPVFITMGQTATSANTQGQGGCSACSAVQYTSTGSSLYTFPYDGVITRWSFATGAVVRDGQWVRARTFRQTDATHARVISQGAQATISATSPSNTVITTWDRIPAAAGDLLGGQYKSSGFIDDTRPLFYDGAASGDIAGQMIPDAALGAIGSATGFGHNRVNMAARFERDTDHDGYGDGSQDLCIEDPAHSTTACSGQLFGTSLQGPWSGGGPCGTVYQCPRVQTRTAGGASTAAAVDGVVVRWRIQAPAAGNYLVRILSPAAGGKYAVTASSAPVTIGSDEALWTIPGRLPIPAGGYVALVPPSTAQQRWAVSPPSGATWTSFSDVSSGTVTLSTPVAGAYMYDADIEPDADRDGYGDVTQDLCATNGATQGICPPPGSPGSGGTPGTDPAPGGDGSSGDRPGGPAGSIGAAVTSLRVRYPRFTSARRPVTRRGKRIRAGTAFIVRVSTGAKVRFTIRRCRSKVGCATSVQIHTLTRTLRTGPTTIRYSGRFRAGGRTRALQPGRYVVEAGVLSAGGLAPQSTRARFTVVR